MIFSGVSKTFSTVGNNQFNSIGQFWDSLSEKYGRENLRGLGYNWTDTTIEYVIGLKNGSVSEENCKVKLPDKGWVLAKGRTDELAQIYGEIYKISPLKYEIETFDSTGELCEILYIRVQEK